MSRLPGLLLHSGCKIRRGRSAPRYSYICPKMVPREVPSLCECVHRWVCLALTSVMHVCILVHHFEQPTEFVLRLVPDWLIDRLHSSLLSRLLSFDQCAFNDGCSEVVTLNQSMHRSFTPPLTGLLNFPIIEHFKDSEIWGHGLDGEGFEGQADLGKLASLLVCFRLLPAPFVCSFRLGVYLQLLVALSRFCAAYRPACGLTRVRCGIAGGEIRLNSPHWTILIHISSETLSTIMMAAAFSTNTPVCMQLPT
jgi:hypothetical protein